MPTIRRLNSLTAANKILAEVQRIIPAGLARTCYVTTVPGRCAGYMIAINSDTLRAGDVSRRCSFGRHYVDPSLVVRWGLLGDFDYGTSIQKEHASSQVVYFPEDAYPDAAVMIVAWLEHGIVPITPRARQDEPTGHG